MKTKSGQILFKSPVSVFHILIVQRGHRLENAYFPCLIRANEFRRPTFPVTDESFLCCYVIGMSFRMGVLETLKGTIHLPAACCSN